MSAEDRDWLLAHLDDQARHLATSVSAAREHRDDVSKLINVRDEVFAIRETLDTLGVPHALVTNADWNRAIGTTYSG